MLLNGQAVKPSRRQWLQMAAAAPFLPGRVGRHLVYDFRGSAAEVGFQHGRTLADEIIAEARPSAEALARRARLSVEATLKRIVQSHEPVFKEHLPGAVEEIQGMAEGARVSYPFAFWAATRDGMREGCTAVVSTGRRGAGGAVLIGQNKDTSAPLDRFRIMRFAYSDGRSMVVLNYPGWIGNLCLSRVGLSFTGNSLYAPRPEGKTMPLSLLKRLIMERRSVCGLLDEIRGMTFGNGCILIAGRDGQAVCLEMVAGRREVCDVSGSAYGHANSILSSSLKQFDTNTSASSPARQKRVEELLVRHSAITVSTLQTIFSDHDGFPLSICQHPDGPKPQGTNASFVADLSENRIHIAIGNPCTAEFVTYDLKTWRQAS